MRSIFVQTFVIQEDGAGPCHDDLQAGRVGLAVHGERMVQRFELLSDPFELPLHKVSFESWMLIYRPRQWAHRIEISLVGIGERQDDVKEARNC